jgi:endonuclease YncB( thermonuclease family)
MRSSKFRFGSGFRRTRPFPILQALVALAALAALMAVAVILEWRIGGGPEISGFAEAIDGDSLRLSGHEMRLKGLDAPEIAQDCQAKDGRMLPCGRTARRALSQVLAGGPVTCTIAGQDRYSRDLVTCTRAGRDIGADLVRDGLAVSFGAYEAEEREAKAAGRGLWATRFERPADWRRAHPREP